MTEDTHALVGFDPGADDLVVVVLRRDDGGPWQLEQVEWPAQVDHAWIAEQVAAFPRPPVWRPPAQYAPTMPELVEQWLAEDQRPDFRLSAEQRALLTEVYADALANGQVSVPQPWPWRR
jgi:hypothetical protein